jgi:hypothetical protein
MPIGAGQAIEVFQTATEENQMSSLRVEQVVHLPEEGEVWMTGDIHDNRTNFSKLVAAADLQNHPHRHLILHELIHGDRYDDQGRDGSWETLYRAAELKCDLPNQVHFLLANHDLAQIYGEGIMKAGISVCEAFTNGVKRDFGNEAAGVNVSITEFLLSLPLAIRCTNGLFFCHSLPTDKQIETFDYSVFARPLKNEDYARRTGPAYQLIWGRHVTPAGVAMFADKMEAQIIVTGHQPQEMGYLVNGTQHLILASDHNQGVFLPINLSETYTMEQLVDRLTKFVSLEV